MQNRGIEDKRSFIINAAYYGLIGLAAVLGAFVFFRYLLGVLYPFFIAYFLALALHPPMMLLHGKAGFPKRVAALLLVTAAVAAVAVLSYRLADRAAEELNKLSQRLEGLTPEKLSPIKERVNSFLLKLPLINSEKDTERLWQGAGERLESFLSDSLPSLSGAVSMLSGLFTGVLDFTLVFIITVVSCYYMTVDRAKISGLFYKIMPESISRHLRTARLELLGAIVKYLKAYGVIILITFTELFVAFTVLRLDYALLLAVVISLVDILPVLGTGTVLLPWALVCLFATRNIYLGTGLIVTYAVITVIRQIIEPKIVGSYIGLHPLATMLSMFAGLRLFGLTGMLLFPFFVLVARNVITKAKENGM